MFNTIFGSFVAPTSSASRPSLATQVSLKHLTIPSDHLSCATKPSNSTDALPPTHHNFFLHAEAERPIAEICWRQKMHSLVSEWTTYAKIRIIESGAKRRNLAQLHPATPPTSKCSRPKASFQTGGLDFQWAFLLSNSQDLLCPHFVPVSSETEVRSLVADSHYRLSVGHNPFQPSKKNSCDATETFGLVKITETLYKKRGYTVDGRNPAPPGMYKTW